MRTLCLMLSISACAFSPRGASPDGAPTTPTQPDAPEADAAPPTADAPPSTCVMHATMEYGGHHYFTTQAEAWQTARGDCMGVGGHLVKIESVGENGFLIGMIVPGYAWIGLARPDGGGDFVWTDGTAPTFTAFSQSPDDQDPDCVDESRTGSWSPYNCDTSEPAICECE